MGIVPEQCRCCDLCGANNPVPLLEKDGGIYVSCPDCGFIWSHCPGQGTEMPADDAEIFDRSVDSFSAKQYTPKKQRHYGRILRSLEPCRKLNRLVEIGCNTGGFLYAARERGWEAIGVEPSKAAAAYGRDTHDLRVLSTFFQNAELEPDSFDVVYSNAVLEHIAEPSATFRKAWDVLRPGGTFLGVTVNWDSFTRELLGVDWKLLNPHGHISLYTPVTLERYCREAGFTEVRISTTGTRSPYGQAGGVVRQINRIRKAWRSTLARIADKGDRVQAIARKPD